jgi:PhnB protein
MPITDGRPDGYTTLTPFLTCSPARDAIDYYCEVFGAVVVERMDLPDGSVAHAELDLGLGRLQLGDPSEQYGLSAPPSRAPEAVSASFVVYVADVDAVVARAVARGATVREPVTTFVTGDRFCSLFDPFGHRWAVMTRVEDVDPQEAQRRVEEWAAAQASAG